MKTWMNIDPDSDFSIYNLPWGVGQLASGETVICSRIGNNVINLAAVAASGLFAGYDVAVTDFYASELNGLIAKGKHVTTGLRLRLQELLLVENAGNPLAQAIQKDGLIPASEVKMLMPVRVGDYTDFYSSIEHATNVGMMFRDPANALLPNWKHIPVGYHGRASSIFVSGAQVKRPKGQVKPATTQIPVFQPTSQLDFELETAFIIGKENPPGSSISTDNADDYIFGMVLFNDLTARDIQSWEYVPLGPFLSKNFASVISPWVVTLEALEPFRCLGPVQQPEVLPYLRFTGNQNYDLNLSVTIGAQNGLDTTICRSNFKFMYWNMAQQLAHHTINGCNMRVGDMCGSGTISGSDPESYGSLLELTWKGSKPLLLNDGTERTFLQDFDTVTLSGYAQKDTIRVGFGECLTRILPAENDNS